MIILGDENLRLREAKSFDISALEAIANEKLIKNYYLINWTLEEYFKNIPLWNKNSKDRNFWGFLIEKKLKTAGFISLTKEENKNKIDFFVAKEFRNQSIATNSLEILIDYSFRNLELNKLNALILKENIASKKTIKKIGFKYLRDKEINLKDYSEYILKISDFTQNI